jgi:hypothetical protein
LQIELNKTAQAIVRINGFPVGQSGFYTVRTWIEEAGKTVAGPFDLKIEIEITRASGPTKVNWITVPMPSRVSALFFVCKFAAVLARVSIEGGDRTPLSL